VREIRVFGRTGPDAAELTKALLLFSRNTSPAHRTQSNQIQYKFDHPDNPYGTFFYVGLYESGEIVGFAMFGYYPRRRVVVFDHLTIAAERRKHGAYYDFASLLKECIEENCPDFAYVVAEITIDPAFADDDFSGAALIWLLRRVGFGRVQTAYFLPTMEKRTYKQNVEAALMLSGAHQTKRIRTEDLLDVYEVILFEHYLPWFRDFFDDWLPQYEAHLKRLFDDFRRRIAKKTTITVNGSRYDELSGTRPHRRKVLLGVPARTVGHFVLFLILLTTVAVISWLLQLSDRAMLLVSLSALLAFSGLAAISDAKAYRVFEKLGGFFMKLFSHK
jgi:hypothetical protein